MRLYAILSDVGSEYETTAPIFISLNKNLIRKKFLADPFESNLHGYQGCIVYIDLDPNLIYDVCGFEDATPKSWTVYEGIEREYTWRNIKTGEIDPNFEDSERCYKEGYDDWEDGCWCKKYIDGKIVEEYFE